MTARLGCLVILTRVGIDVNSVQKGGARRAPKGALEVPGEEPAPSSGLRSREPAGERQRSDEHAAADRRCSRGRCSHGRRLKHLPTAGLLQSWQYLQHCGCLGAD
jgi:hypothetical protein